VPFYTTSYPVKVTLNTDSKAGAHTNHMISQSFGISASTACTDCHGTVTLTVATHMNGATTFVWSNLATGNGLLSPAYTAASGQCTATYCHGNSMPGGDTSGSNKAPVWNNPNYLPATLTAAACGTCHGFPPPVASGHPGGIVIPAGFPASAAIGTTCSCHSNVGTTGNSYANIFVNPALHINGIFEATAGGHAFPYGGSLHLVAAGTTPWPACTGCHVNAAGGTYPVAAGSAPNCTGCHLQGLRVPSGTSSCWDCHGPSATNGRPNGNAFPNISGNHTVHMALTGAACATCHTGGGSGVATHGSSNRVAATPASVKVVFTGQGTSPLWTLASKTCSATNCHGQGAPVWGARAGAPVNGFPYSTSQCGKCHGTTTSNPFYSNAIPKITATSDAKVGTHFMHLTSSTIKLAKSVHCNDCHAIPSTVTAATHMNGATNFAWSQLATRNGALTPSYNTTTRQCSNVYCHGAAMPSGDTTGSNRTPVWNLPFLPATISAAACGSCHGFPPAAASGHPTGITIPAGFGNGSVAIGATCSCHANINSAGTTYANIFVNRALHIDGTLQVSGGHAFPFPGASHLATAGTTPWASCVTSGCHANSTGGTYPVAVGTPPNCTGCHLQGLRVPSGTSSCWDCHGSTATNGRPNGTLFPNRARRHNSPGAHAVVCAVCHAGGGTGIAAHGNSNRVLKTSANVKLQFSITGTVASDSNMVITRSGTTVTCTGLCHISGGASLNHNETW
jgi:predicted CxxxxCH...CXXCH cytochrome family protein